MKDRLPVHKLARIPHTPCYEGTSRDPRKEPQKDDWLTDGDHDIRVDSVANGVVCYSRYKKHKDKPKRGFPEGSKVIRSGAQSAEMTLAKWQQRMAAHKVLQ